MSMVSLTDKYLRPFCFGRTHTDAAYRYIHCADLYRGRIKMACEALQICPSVELSYYLALQYYPSSASRRGVNISNEVVQVSTKANNSEATFKYRRSIVGHLDVRMSYVTAANPDVAGMWLHDCGSWLMQISNLKNLLDGNYWCPCLDLHPNVSRRDYGRAQDGRGFIMVRMACASAHAILFFCRQRPRPLHTKA